MQFRDHLDRLSGRPRSPPRPASKIAITYTACPRNRQLRNSISSRSARHRTEFRRGGRRSELTAGLHTGRWCLLSSFVGWPTSALLSFFTKKNEIDDNRGPSRRTWIGCEDAASDGRGILMGFARWLKMRRKIKVARVVDKENWRIFEQTKLFWKAVSRSWFAFDGFLNQGNAVNCKKMFPRERVESNL